MLEGSDAKLQVQAGPGGGKMAGAGSDFSARSVFTPLSFTFLSGHAAASEAAV